MDSKTYRARITDLLSEAHELHQRVVTTMDATGGDAHTAEWQMLYSVMQAVGVACSIMAESVKVRPTALREPVMVCTVCLEPLEGDAENNYWYHTSENAAEECPRKERIRAVAADKVAQ